MTTGRFAREIAANRANWDARAAVHSQSPFYDLQRYIRDEHALSGVVEWDRQVLGDVYGLDMLHLQCHIGTDSVSWARLGANVVGLDLSPESLRIAEDMAARTGADIEFVCGDALEADRLVGRRFDIVYASVGILSWIPDVRQWARAATACLRPGGRLYLRDDHPVRSMLETGLDEQAGKGGDYAAPGRAGGERPGSGSGLLWTGDYFATAAERIDSPYTYTGDKTPLTATVSYQWTHGLGTIITALAEQGLRIERVDELDWLDWQPFPWMVLDADGRCRFPSGGPRVPLAYSILARAPE